MQLTDHSTGNFVLPLSVAYILALGVPKMESIAALVLTFAFVLTLGREARFLKFDLLDVALIAYLLSGVVSLLASDYKLHGLIQSLHLLWATMLYWIVSRFAGTTREGMYLPIAFVLLSFVLQLRILVESFGAVHKSPTELVIALNSPTLVVPNDALLLVISFPFMVAWAIATKRFSVKFSAFAYFLLLVVCVVTVQSRSSFALLICGVGLMIAFSPSKVMPISKLKLTLSSFAIFLVGIAILDGFRDFSLMRKIVSSGSSRFAVWDAGVKMFMDAPLLGHGPRSYEVLYRHYVDITLLPMSPSGTVDTRQTPWAHNTFVETLAEQGIIGLVCVLFVLLASIRIWFKLNDHVKQSPFGVAILVSSILFVLAGLVELSAERLWVANMAAVLAASLKLLDQPSRPYDQAKQQE